MPELPEVQSVVDSLAPHLVGQTIEAAELRRADFVNPIGFDLATALRGRTIVAITRRAKRIVLDLDDGNRLYFHLGMTGRLTVELRTAVELKHLHFVIRMQAVDVHFVDPRRFGGIFWLGRRNGHDGLGPEPLTVSAGDFHRRLAKTSRAIKTALLDQRLVAGLGNIYVDEALFHAAIYPLRRADSISFEEAKRLTRAIKFVLRRAIQLGGSTIRDYVNAAGNKGSAQTRHRVYGREGKPCANCKSPIIRIVVQQRSTHYCKTCQPELFYTKVAKARRRRKKN